MSLALKYRLSANGSQSPDTRMNDVVKIENGKIMDLEPNCLKPSAPCGQRGLHCYVSFTEQYTITWFDIEKTMLPPQEHCERYGDRYSCPVLIANAKTGQREKHTVVYDYEDGGWCLYGLPDGPSCRDYDLMSPTHYCLLPGFAT